MLKACIFDLDGTLAFTLESMWAPANEMLRQFGLKEPKQTNNAGQKAGVALFTHNYF